MSSITAVSVAHDEGTPPDSRRIMATLALLAAIVLAVLDGAIANVALPSLAQALRVDAAGSVWVVTAYQLALVMALLPCAALGDGLGHRRVFMAGVLVFTVASALCAVAPALPVLVAARFVQGLGGAAIASLGVALLRSIWPPARIGAAIGWNAMAIALSAAAGPAVGAGILSVASWPWLFAVNLPIGVLVLVLGHALPSVPGSGRRVDAVSVMLNAGMFGALVIGADIVAVRPLVGGGLLAVAGAGLVALLRREMPLVAPLIPLDLLRGRSFRISVIASVCCFIGQMASYVALPFYLQHGMGLSEFGTGLAMMPWPLMVAVAAPLSGRVADRVATAWLCAAGGACLGIGLAFVALWPSDGGVVPVIGFTMLAGLGFGFFQTPNNRNMLMSASRARSGAAGGMQGTARLLGQTMGGVLMSVLFARSGAGPAARGGLVIAAGFAMAAAVISLLRGGRGGE